VSIAEDPPELVDVHITAERVRGTQLVHVAVGDRAGLVLTVAEAHGLVRELLRAARRASGPPRPRARLRAAAAA